MKCPHCGQGMPENGPVKVDLTTNTVTFGATSIKFQPKQAELLYILNSHPVTTRVVAMFGLHGNGHWPQDKIIDVYICKLRARLAGTALSIETIRGKGWRLRLEGVTKLVMVPTEPSEVMVDAGWLEYECAGNPGEMYRAMVAAYVEKEEL